MTISKITVENYKSHLSTTLELSFLNVLSGVNGVGKSSIIQSLLLLRQSFEKNALSQGLDLNTPYCEIGTFADALCQSTEKDFLRFILFDSIQQEFDWKFKPETNALNDTFVPSYGSVPRGYELLNLFTENFQYISAARWAPRESYPMNTNLVERRRRLSIEKGQCELIAHFLYYYGKEKREQVQATDLINPNSEESDLLSQTSAWEREISPNVNVVPTNAGRSFSIKYSFNRTGDIVATNEFSAENVGFGLSYALPVIVTLLSAKPGSLLLIENPEAHLHPKGQAKVAELIALAANNGVQIILETHSEHILNGILIACKNFERAEKGIDREFVRFYHFGRNDEFHTATFSKITVLEGGRTDTQPEYFFDQAENDLGYLLNLQ